LVLGQAPGDIEKQTIKQQDFLMKTHLFAETELHLSDFEGDELIFTQESEALYYGAIAMFVTSLGRCTYAVLSNYAMRLDLDPDNITIKLNWDFAYEPTVISEIDMQITWPELPDSRRKAVERAAHLCTVHNTIKECVEITTRVNA
jgi:uncharacterized OsmC-like protein